MKKIIIKEDMQEAKERMKAWWDYERTDRPVIFYIIFEGSGSEKIFSKKKVFGDI